MALTTTLAASTIGGTGGTGTFNIMKFICVAGLTGAILAVGGPTYGLTAGLVLYFLVFCKKIFYLEANMQKMHICMLMNVSRGGDEILCWSKKDSRVKRTSLSTPVKDKT